MPQETKAIPVQSPQASNNLQSVKMSFKGDVRTPKPPKPPEKPLMPYMRYSRKVWEQVKNSNPHMKLWEVGKIIGQMWRELPDDEKTLYVEDYDTEKAQYTEALRQYHSSPTYQAWLVAKERAEKLIEEQDQERKQTNVRPRDRVADLAPIDMRESYILEDNEEDPEDQYTAKHVAAARFQRNHRLMQEILSDSRLPDPGQLITQSRLSTLRLQVEQLKNHKRNLCREIEGCESRHGSKLQRVQDDSDKFVAEYEKLTTARPMITESQFADMIVKAKHTMQREEEERVSRFLAEGEMRRRKQQQQQRQQREAELAAEAAERRRQQIQQQQALQMQQPIKLQPPQHNEGESTQQQQQQQQQPSDRIAERSPMIGEPKMEPMPQPSKSPAPILGGAYGPKPTPNSVEGGMPMPGQSPYASPCPPNYAHMAQRFPQSGHTQHHYPPPNYPPNAISPATMASMPPRGQPHQLAGPPPPPPAGLIRVNASMPMKKNQQSSVPASNSGTSSTTPAKRKKSDPMVNSNNNANLGKDKKPDIGMHVTGLPPGSVPPSGPTDHPVASSVAMGPGDYMHGPGIPLNVMRHPNSQGYGPPSAQSPQQQPSMLPHGVHIPGGHAPNQPGFSSYEHHGAGAPAPGGPGMPVSGAYYHHPSQMGGQPHQAGFPHRPPFGHVSYGLPHYPAGHPASSTEHPGASQAPPPPMYVQHMSQPTQQQQSHMAQSQPGPLIGSPPPSHAGSPHPSRTQAGVGWHQGGPPSGAYAPSQYGPSPRYAGPPQYTGHPAPPSAYNMPGSHPVGPHHPGPQPPLPPPTSAPSGDPGSAGPQPQAQIPAPPPYQQQQQQHQQQQQATGFSPGYWAPPHHVPTEYAGHQSPYVTGPDGAPPGMPPSSMEGMQSGGIAMHQDAPGHVAGPPQPQHAAMYYSGYPHSSVQGSYGPPGSMPSGFYPPPQQQHPQQQQQQQHPQHHNSPYPQPHQGPPHNAPWAGYAPPTHMNQHPQHGYPGQPMPPHHQQQQSPMATGLPQPPAPGQQQAQLLNNTNNTVGNVKPEGINPNAVPSAPCMENINPPVNNTVPSGVSSRPASVGSQNGQGST